MNPEINSDWVLLFSAKGSTSTLYVYWNHTSRVVDVVQVNDDAESITTQLTAEKAIDLLTKLEVIK